MTKIDVNDAMALETGERAEHLHVQISKANKRFLKLAAKRQGIKMGLYLDKLLSAVRTGGQKS